MSKMTLEDFENLASSLPEGANQKRLAKLLGVELPPEQVKSVADQLADVKVIKHTPKVKTKQAQEQTYVSVPNINLGDEGNARGFWVRATTARETAKRILEVLDENGL